jgi:hypothetical protein
MKLKDKARRFALAGVTLCSALSIGVAMQQSEAKTAPVRTSAQLESAQDSTRAQNALPLTLTDVVETSAFPRMPRDATAPTALQSDPVRLVAAQDLAIVPMPTETDAPQIGCDIDFTSETAAAAMVTLNLTASCLPNERVTIHHNGMMFTAVTDLAGALNLTVPSLSENAVFIAAFANGDGAVTNAEVPSLAFYDRVALQSKSTGKLELHALEFGSGYGETGHIWRENPRTISAVITGEGGFLTHLGDSASPEALMVDVYTFPAITASRDGIIALSVETEVGASNCGQEIAAQTIEIRNGNAPKVQDLTLAMPECDATGDFLVLKNILEDLTIARNE